MRWLGRVRYEDASELQHALRRGGGDYLLLLEHPHVYTLGVRTDPDHLLDGVASSGASVVRADRGGDVTYHGPGQLVGYPILDLAMGPGAVPAHVQRMEQLVIDVLSDLGLPGAARLEGYPGVWVGADGGAPRKICAIGVRVQRGRSMHGLALNVDPDLAMFANIVPCGIADKPVTSLAAEGITATMAEVVDAVSARAAQLLGPLGPARHVERQDACAPAAAGVPGDGQRAPLPIEAPAARAAPGCLGRRPAIRSRRARAQARLHASSSQGGQAGDRLEIDASRARSRHGLRGGGLPEPLGMLGRRHSHLHDQWGALYEGVRLLPGRHAAPAATRPR